MRPKAVRLTERDLTLLRFIAEHPFVTAAQAAAAIASTRRTAAARLSVLSDAGFLRRLDSPTCGTDCHKITRSGLRICDCDLGVPRTSRLASHRHDHALAWLMLSAQRGAMGPLREIVGERRMRSEDERAEDGHVRHAVRRGGYGPSGRALVHYPDLIVTTAGGRRVAFELELSIKNTRLREQILAAYAADRRIDAVIYLTDSPSVRRAILRSAGRVGALHLVRVAPVDVGRRPAPGMSTPAAQRTRVRGAGAMPARERAGSGARERARGSER
ncbi:MAG: hypothetical protein ACRDMX_18080 [Solirubrobacteraceae bacterium]